MTEESGLQSSSGFLRLPSKRQFDAQSEEGSDEVSAARQQLYASLEARCPVNHNNMCVIECRHKSGATTLVLTKSKGKLWTYMGTTVQGERHLYPEEAIFLMSMCSARLLREGVPLNLCQAFQLLLGHDTVLWNRHMVYDHLRRAGYIVVRHAGPTLRSSDASGTPNPVVDVPEGTTGPSADDSLYRSLEPIYDVHLADSGYTFGSKRKPHLRLLVLSADDLVPSADDLIVLQSRFDDDCPLHVACVEGSSISFFHLRAVRTVDLAGEAAATEEDQRRDDAAV